MINLTESVIRSFKVAKVFNENMDKINGIDFQSNGKGLVSCSEDEQIVLYNAEEGIKKRTLNSYKYGVGNIRFTSGDNKVIHSSTKVDNNLRYLSLNNNNYISYFSGHTDKVLSLSVSPFEETFISTSLDKTLRLWDLRSANSKGIINMSGRPIAAYDPEGLIFAVGVDSEAIKLYDVRAFDKGPFNAFKFDKENEREWTGMKFSHDGKMILIGTNGSVIRLIDAFHGNALKTFTDFANNQAIPIEASLSPDGKFVLSGSTDGRVHVWNANTGCKVCVLKGNHTGPVQALQCNPKYGMFASACATMSFWLPTEGV